MELEALGPIGEGIATTAKRHAIKPQDAWIFRQMLGATTDWWFLSDVYDFLPELREGFKRLRESGFSEGDSIAKVIQVVRDHFEVMAVQGNVAFDKTRGMISPLEPAASLPLSYAKRYRLEIIADEYLFNECSSRDEMTQEVIERALSKLSEQTRMEIRA